MANFTELRLELHETWNPEKRAVVLDAICKIGTFNELYIILGESFDEGERTLVVIAMLEKDDIKFDDLANMRESTFRSKEKDLIFGVLLKIGNIEQLSNLAKTIQSPIDKHVDATVGN